MLPGPYKQTPAQHLSRASRKPAVERTSAERHAGAFARQFCADKYRCLRVWATPAASSVFGQVNEPERQICRQVSGSRPNERMAEPRPAWA